MHAFTPTDTERRSVPTPEPCDFREIFDEHAPVVWRALRRLGVSEADVQDVAQEVFVVVHRRLADFEGRSSLRTWIYGICVRAASDHRRRAYVRREHAVEEVPEIAVPPEQDADLERREAASQLDALLSELDDSKRQVFVLFEIEELPMVEVAEVVGCPLKTAFSRLYAARRAVENAARRLRARRELR